MSRSTASRSHRGAKSALRLSLVSVAALTVAASLIGRADAATPGEVRSDCQAASDRLKSCDFVQTGYKVNWGPNTQVSPSLRNCGIEESSRKEFEVTVESIRSIVHEDGYYSEYGFMLSGSIVGVGGIFKKAGYNIDGEERGKSFTMRLGGDVEPNHEAFVMFSARRLDVSGYYRAVYKDGGEQFAPSKGGNSIHVFYPLMLDNDIPDGDLWIRNVPCSSASTGPGVSLSQAPEPSGEVTTAGFGQAGDGVIDKKISWSSQ